VRFWQLPAVTDLDTLRVPLWRSPLGRYIEPLTSYRSLRIALFISYRSMSAQALSLAELLRLRSLSSSGTSLGSTCPGASAWSKRRREKLFLLRARAGEVQQTLSHSGSLLEEAHCSFCSIVDTSIAETDGNGVTGSDESQKQRLRAAIGATSRRTRGRAPRRLSTEIHGLEDVAQFWALYKALSTSKVDNKVGVDHVKIDDMETREVSTLHNRYSPLSESVLHTPDRNLVSVAQRLNFDPTDDRGASYYTPIHSSVGPAEHHQSSDFHFVRGRKRSRIQSSESEGSARNALEGHSTLDSPQTKHHESVQVQRLEICTPEKYRASQLEHGFDLSFGDDAPQCDQGPVFEYTPENQKELSHDESANPEVRIVQLPAEPSSTVTKAIQTENETTFEVVNRPRRVMCAGDFLSQTEREKYMSHRQKIKFTASDTFRNGRRSRMRVLRFWRGETLEYAFNERFRFPTIDSLITAPASPRDMLPADRRRYCKATPKSGFRTFCRSRIVTPERAAFYADVRPNMLWARS